MSTSLRKIVWLLFVFIIAGGLFGPSLTYAQSSSGSLLTENAYLLDDQVTLSQPAAKDVLIMGGDVIIDAPISGDLQVIARTVHLKASVIGDVRIAAGEIYIEKSHVGEDLLLAGGNVVLDKTMSSSGTTMIYAATADVSGHTGSSLHIKASDLTIGGTHDGMIEIEAPILKILENFHANKSFTYATNSEVTPPQNSVLGAVKKQAIEHQDTPLLEKIAAAFSTFFSLFLALIILSWYFPSLLMERVQIMRTETLSSFVKGCLGAFLLPVLLFVVLITLLGFPFGVALIFAYLALLCFTPLLAVMYVGSLVLNEGSMERRYLLRVALVGSVIVTLILQIPVIGTFIVILLSAIGLGSCLRKE